MRVFRGDKSGQVFEAVPGYAAVGFRGIPWASVGSWRQAQLSLRQSLAVSEADLGKAVNLAGRILHRYDLAGALFDEVTDATCKVCRRPCCRDARVWLDFKDLLLIHLTGRAPPPGQLRRDRHSRCRYLTVRGCALLRGARPWVCTWYICPDQRRALARDIPGGVRLLARWWPEITALRSRMETAFAAGVLPPRPGDPPR
jgi:hypothetical protein